MPDIDVIEAVRLAAEAIGCKAFYDEGECDDCTAAVTAALPALAEQFAALIEARCLADEHGWFIEDRARDEVCSRCTDAARLVREAAEVTG